MVAFTSLTVFPALGRCFCELSSANADILLLSYNLIGSDKVELQPYQLNDSFLSLPTESHGCFFLLCFASQNFLFFPFVLSPALLYL